MARLFGHKAGKQRELDETEVHAFTRNLTDVKEI
jgi:hypothetical protein